MVRPSLKALPLVALQFFILSFMFKLFFDPIGIGYFLIGLVYLFNKKLAIAEILGIFFLKGEYGLAFTAPAWASLTHNPTVQTVMTQALFIEIPVAWCLGAIMAVQISAKILKMKIEKQAPDILGMITR